MTHFINKSQKGLTLFETLLSLSIIMALVVSFLYWYLEQQREQQATIFGKDIVSIITAFDKRIHLDGWDIDNFKNGSEWSGSPDILEMLNNEFIAKEATCGNPKSWVPVLAKEKSTQLIPCKFWSRVPYDFIVKAKITPDDEGFIKDYKVIFQSKSNKSFSENFRYYNRAKIAANANDSLNVTGGHQFYFAALSDPTTKITNTECLALKADCTLVATYDREGGNEYLRVDGTNSMLGSAVAFKESKGHNRLRCIKWEKNTNSGAWDSKTVDCGIGIHAETGSPVAVDIAVNSSTNQRVMLDRLCPVYTHSADGLINSTQKAPCGILSQDDAGTEVAYQVIDTLSAGKGLIKTLYTDIIYSDEINTNYMKVKKDLVVNGKTDLNGILTVNATTNLNQRLNVAGDIVGGSSLTINKNITANTGNLNATSGSVNAKDGNFSGNVKSNTLDISSTANFQGTTNANGRFNSNEYISLNKVVTVNSSCPSLGLLARNSQGKILTCQGGRWTLQYTPVYLTTSKSSIDNMQGGSPGQNCLQQAGDDPRSVNYWLSCGSRYCRSQGYGGGQVLEMSCESPSCTVNTICF